MDISGERRTFDMFTDVHDVHHVHSADDAFKAEVPRLRSGFRQQTLTPATAKEALAGEPEAPALLTPAKRLQIVKERMPALAGWSWNPKSTALSQAGSYIESRFQHNWFF